MAKKDVYGHERVRTERVFGLVAVGAVVFCLSFALAFAPSVTYPTPAWAVGLLVGLVLMDLFVVFAAVVVIGRYRVAKAASQNRIYEMADPELIELEPPIFPIDPGVVQQSPAVRDWERKRIQGGELALHAGQNEAGEHIGWWAMRLGGWQIGKTSRWLEAGDDGYLIGFGRGAFVQMMQNRIFPRDFILMRHDAVDPKVLTQLKRATDGHFVPFKTPLYRVGDMSPEWVEWIRTSPEVRQMVFDATGLRPFTLDLVRILRRNKVAMANPTKVELAQLMRAIENWLERKGVDVAPLQRGYASPQYWMSQYFGESTQRIAVETANFTLRAENEELRAALRGEAHRAASLYEVQRSYGPPAVAGQMERVPGYRIRGEGEYP